MDTNGRVMKALNNDRGVAIVYIALMITVLLAFVGLAVDLGYMYVAKGQMQNAADAAALAGAGGLYPTSSSTTLSSLPPNWSSGESVAESFVNQNVVAGTNLSLKDPTCNIAITTGYWNLDQIPSGMQGQTISPKFQCSDSKNACTPQTASANCPTGACLQKDVAAVQVTVQKTIPTFFAKVFNFSTMAPSATAVAARGYPRIAKKLFPIAASRCMAETYSALLPNAPIIKFQAPYPPDSTTCVSTEWTGFGLGSGAGEIKKMLDGTTETPTVSIGESIDIDNGVKAGIYNELSSYVNQTVYIPIVADNFINPGNTSMIVGIAGFNITSVVKQGNDSIISGKLVSYTTDINASGIGGAQSNLITPPILIK